MVGVFPLITYHFIKVNQEVNLCRDWNVLGLTVVQALLKIIQIVKRKRLKRDDITALIPIFNVNLKAKFTFCWWLSS